MESSEISTSQLRQPTATATAKAEGGARLVLEVISEIERLRRCEIAWQLAEAEIKRLRAALIEIRSLNDGMDPTVEDCARDALEGATEAAR